jgi:type IV secretory pathway VirB4 component
MRLPAFVRRTRQHQDRNRLAAETAALEVAVAVGPDCVEVGARRIRLGLGYAATYAVTGYPAVVGIAWLETVLSWPGRLDVAIHIDPISNATAAGQLRRSRAKLESSRRIEADKGKLGDPGVDAAAQDAADLADRIARGAAKLFDTGIYITVHAATEDALAEACAQVRAAAAATLIEVHPVTHRHLQGWTSTLPLGVDSIRLPRILDTHALAAAFPFGSPDLPTPLPGDSPATGGILYGVNLASPGVVVWDRWAQDNHNSVLLARSGSGKSYLTKLEVLRNLYHDVQVAVVDPEDEYVRLAERVGGTVVQLGAPGVRLNPLDIPTGDRRPDALNRRCLFLHTVVAVLAGTTGATLPPQETAVLDAAINATYNTAGITSDPATWDTPAPLLHDLHTTLAADRDPAAQSLAARLAPWTVGSFKSLFDGATTSRPDGHLVVWSLRHLTDEVKTVGTLLALDHIWRTIDTPPTTRSGRARQRRRRLVVVDEAWLMLRDGTAATWLFKMAKAARKRDAGLAVITQDAADVLGTDLGRAVIANAATQILMRQAPQTIDQVTDAFRLTDAERHGLLAARRGEALLVAGAHRVRFEVIADTDENDLASPVTPAATPRQRGTAGEPGDDADLF